LAAADMNAIIAPDPNSSIGFICAP
jgi:hypothetical protein